MKSDCCNAEISGGSGYFYVTPQIFPKIKGNPLNLPKPEFICSKCKKPCYLAKEKEKEIPK